MTQAQSVPTPSVSLLTGAGWASNLEHDARRLASVARIPSIAVIDHWVNYTQRVEREGVVILPEEIWVSDPYAAEIAKELFKGIAVV